MVLPQINLTPEPPMPLSVAELHGALHELFSGTARDLARLTGFCQRERDLTGPAFARALVFCLLQNPASSLDDFAQFASDHLDLDVTPNAFDERFGRGSARFLMALFLEAFDFSFASARAALLPVLRRFKGVYLRDATTVRLPACLAHLLPGRKGRPDVDAAAAVKLVLEVEVTSGRFTEASVLAGTDNEKAAPVSSKPLPAGALLLEDMGFLSGERLQGYVEQGVYVLTRVPCWTAFYLKKAGGSRGWTWSSGCARPKAGTRSAWCVSSTGRSWRCACWRSACPTGWPNKGGGGCAKRRRSAAGRSARRSWSCASGTSC